MQKIILYTTQTCPYCIYAKKLLEQKGLSYTEIRIDLNPVMRDEMINLTGRKTVPQIIINGDPIGGFDDLHALDVSGKLDEILQKTP
jgi:glutaredoxin 3